MVDFYPDYFTAEALTASIVKQQYIPGQLGELGIFENEPLPGTLFSIDEQTANAASVLSSTPRGTPSKAQTLVKNKVHTFQTSHYREDSALYADSVLNMRASGVTAMRDVITTLRDKELALLRRKIDYTHEALRMEVINTPDNSFGSSPADATVGFGASDTAINSALFDNVKLPIMSALGGTQFSGIVGLCSDTYFKGLLESKTIRETYLNQQAANSLRTQTLMEAVTYGGITWIWYRGAGATVIESGKAKVFPTGVPGMFRQAFAPADTLDSIGAGVLGSPYFVQGYPIDGGNRGWHLEAQTNCVMVCTRPQAVLTLKLS